MLWNGSPRHTGATMTDNKTETTKAKPSKADRLEALKQKQEQLKAKIAALEAKEKAADRKKDARRKIIIGGAVLAHAALDPAFAVELKAILKKAVTRERDLETIRDILG